MNETDTMAVHVLDYDLTGMAGEILEVVTGKGFVGITPEQRREIDDIIYKYAERAVALVGGFDE